MKDKALIANNFYWCTGIKLNRNLLAIRQYTIHVKLPSPTQSINPSIPQSFSYTGGMLLLSTGGMDG